MLYYQFFLDLIDITIILFTFIYFFIIIKIFCLFFYKIIKYGTKVEKYYFKNEKFIFFSIYNFLNLNSL